MTAMIRVNDTLTAAVAVCYGMYGAGEERKQNLVADGFDYEKVQSLVNDLVPVLKNHGVM